MGMPVSSFPMVQILQFVHLLLGSCGREYDAMVEEMLLNFLF